MLEIHDLQTFICKTFLEKKFPVYFNTFLVIWLQEGEGVLQIDNKKNVVKNDTVYFISWGQAYFFEGFDCMKGYALLFTLEFLGPLKNSSALLLNSGLFNNNSIASVSLCAETKIEMEQLICSMLREKMSAQELTAEILRSYLKLLLLRLACIKNIAVPGHSKIMGDTSLVSQFLEMVQLHFIPMKKVADYAKKLSVTPNQLNKRVKDVTAFSASHHIQQTIISEAKRQASQMSLKEISYMLGFDDLSHFSKFFRNSTGTNFSDFKRSEFQSIL